MFQGKVGPTREAIEGLYNTLELLICAESYFRSSSHGSFTVKVFVELVSFTDVLAITTFRITTAVPYLTITKTCEMIPLQLEAQDSEFKMSSPKSPKSPKEFEFHNQSALRVTDEDIHQIELFFLSLKSRVFVCPALANLYFATLEDMASLGGWELQTTGFPTLILESGDLDGNRQGRLSLCIAEKGTGFILWKDVISKETGYKAPERNFHTMTVSEDKGKLAGLSFDDEGSAINFYHKVQTWIEEDFALRHSEYKKKGKKNKDKKKKLPKQKLPRKETISLPCCFEHVTKLDHEGYIQRAMGGLNSPEFFTQSADHSGSCDRTEFSARSLPGDVQSSPKREIISLKGDGGNGSHYAGSVAGFSESTTGSNDDSGLDEI